MARRGLSLVSSHPDVGGRLLGGARTGDSQRARLLEAITGVVAERGYASATVADIVRAAGVSRSTFYEQFTSKEQCFVEAYRHGSEVLDQRIAAAVKAAVGGWREELRAGIHAFLDTLADEPMFARAYVLEIHAAGPAPLAERDESLRRFARRYRATFRRAKREQPALAIPSDDLLLVFTAGTDHLVAERLRAGAAPTLRDLEPIFLRTAEALAHPTQTGG